MNDDVISVDVVCPQCDAALTALVVIANGTHAVEDLVGCSHTGDLQTDWEFLAMLSEVVNLL